MNNEQPKLTAGELSHLWENLMNNSAASVVLDYFHRITEADEIRSVCAFALQMVLTDKNEMEHFLKTENYPLPEGFSQKDMNSDARKPVTDVFVLFFLHQMAQTDLVKTAVSLADAVRQDLRKQYSNRMVKSMELHQKAVSLLLEKGLFLRSPFIPSTHEVQPMAKKGFLSNVFGNNPRSLTAREANELHKNVVNNHIGRSLLMTFYQSNQHTELKELLLRGKALASKLVNEFSSVLIENDLPVAMTWDSHVLDSTDSPFSDRLIAFLLDQMNKLGVANYGYGFAVSARKDIKAMYTRIVADVYQYELDVKNLMIDRGWLERPPMALDRRNLAEV